MGVQLLVRRKCQPLRRAMARSPQLIKLVLLVGALAMAKWAVGPTFVPPPSASRAADAPNGVVAGVVGGLPLLVGQQALATDWREYSQDEGSGAGFGLIIGLVLVVLGVSSAVANAGKAEAPAKK